MLFCKGNQELYSISTLKFNASIPALLGKGKKMLKAYWMSDLYLEGCPKTE
jgi:hypothetical protein